MKIIMGSDHAGFSLKEEIKKYLSDTGIEITDVGTYSDESVDYPDYGSEVARKVSSGDFERGILVCGSGVGMAIVANKYPHVRAALVLDTDTARMSRKHNDTNIIALAGRKTDHETAKAIVKIWLDTDFEGGRHSQRLNKIRTIEDSFHQI